MSIMVQSKHAQALLLGTGNNSWTLILDARESPAFGEDTLYIPILLKHLHGSEM